MLRTHRDTPRSTYSRIPRTFDLGSHAQSRVVFTKVQLRVKYALSLDIRKSSFEALRIEAVAIFPKKDKLAQRFTVLPTNDLLDWISEA